MMIGSSTIVGAQVSSASGSDTLVIGGIVSQPLAVDAAALGKLDSTHFRVADGAADSADFRGTLVWDLFKRAGIEADSARKGDNLRMILIATGADGYSVILAGAELIPEFAYTPAFVAVEMNRSALDKSRGMAELIVPGDRKHCRWVHQLVRLELRWTDTR